MELTHASLALVGFPETGKTSFLAALWEIVFNSRSSLLHLEVLPEDRLYLLAIHRRWLEGKEAIKTRDQQLLGGVHGQMQTISLRLRGPTSEIAITVPDLAGETFNNVWEKRLWPEELASALRHCHGAIVFVHPQKVVYPTSIAYLNHLRSEPGHDMDEGTEKDVKWDPAMSPTDVKLCDLLLQISKSREVEELPIAIAVSAWDTVAYGGLHPDDWVNVNLPLLHQMLRSNPEILPSRTFGISAQGGDFTDQAALGTLREKDPAERPFLALDGEVNHDLTLAVQWILNKP